jgi:hypothetical protein
MKYHCISEMKIQSRKNYYIKDDDYLRHTLCGFHLLHIHVYFTSICTKVPVASPPAPAGAAAGAVALSVAPLVPLAVAWASALA